jgi:O-acetyl-ADP-ribose deacetylase (regulator of RNase III)
MNTLFALPPPPPRTPIVRQPGNPIETAGVVMTKAGRLRSSNIIHAVAASNASSWMDVIFACLEMAESKKLASIALPAQGTGTTE